MDNSGLLALVSKVLDDAYLMSLGTVDKSGVWVADVIYVHDENFNLFWLSLPDARHSKALRSEPRVACTVTASWKTDAERALQIEGTASVVDGARFDFEKRLAAKRGLPSPSSPGEALAEGYFWYVLRPERVELLHSEPFGYARQTVKLPR
jgi:hypothetical protein